MFLKPRYFSDQFFLVLDLTLCPTLYTIYIAVAQMFCRLAVSTGWFKKPDLFERW